MKLLIVDDSIVIRRAIQKFLAPLGLEVAGEAANGKAALELFAKSRPEVVTLDITMPEMDGLTCLKAMLELDRNVRVLVVTALTDEATALQALKMGARGFLAKPFTPDQLSAALQRILT